MFSACRSLNFVSQYNTYALNIVLLFKLQQMDKMSDLMSVCNFCTTSFVRASSVLTGKTFCDDVTVSPLCKEPQRAK